MVYTDGGSYWVVPDEECPELFHISRLYAKAGEDLFDGTRWAEPAERVEIRLIGFGLPNPHQVQWRVRDRTGLPQPFGAPPGHGMIRVIDRRGRSRLVPDAP
ncbi:MAG: hypothetical protein RI949_1371 [Pseudomonadota bacterium]|jgi:hypothetical protein